MSSSSSSRFRRSAVSRSDDQNDNNNRSHRSSSSSSHQQQSTSRSTLNNGNGGTLGISTTKNSFRTTRRHHHHHRPGEVTPTITANDAPVAVAAATASSSSSSSSLDVQGDLVDYGMSLNVKDEQRRDIQVEITVIATSNDKTNKSLGEETKIEEQIKKGLRHAEKEQLKLDEGASAQLESTKDYSDFTKELDQRFKLGIVECTTPTPVLSNGSTSTSSSSSNLHASSNLNPITPDGRINHDQSNNGNNEEESSRVSNRRIVDEKNALGDTILRTLRKEIRDIKDTEMEQKNLNEKRVQLEQSMELQGLRQSLEREQGNVRRLQSEVQQDRDAKSTRVVEIQQSHDSSGTKAQKIIDLVRTYVV
jgi:t-SNARE complex subunit (syntaxin)